MFVIAKSTRNVIKSPHDDRHVPDNGQFILIHQINIAMASPAFFRTGSLRISISMLAYQMVPVFWHPMG